MKIQDILCEGRDAPLYHGVEDIIRAVLALRQNVLLGKTLHMNWDQNGLRSTTAHNDIAARNSTDGKKWGISTTRDLTFALRWGEVVFELDQTKILQKYPIMPINYFYSAVSTRHPKEEREEFIVTQNHGGEIPLLPYLKKIYLDSWLIAMDDGSDDDGIDDGIDYIQRHPLYAGLYERRNGIVRLVR